MCAPPSSPSLLPIPWESIRQLVNEDESSSGIFVAPQMAQYARDIAAALRQHGRVAFGPSPQAMQAFMHAAKSVATAERSGRARVGGRAGRRTSARGQRSNVAHSFTHADLCSFLLLLPPALLCRAGATHSSAAAVSCGPSTSTASQVAHAHAHAPAERSALVQLGRQHRAGGRSLMFLALGIVAALLVLSCLLFVQRSLCVTDCCCARRVAAGHDRQPRDCSSDT